MKEIAVTTGITELTGPAEGRWFIHPKDEGVIDLRQPTGSGAYVSVSANGVYYIGFASASGVEWVKLVRGASPQPSGPGFFSRLLGKVKAAWPAAKAVSKTVAPYLLGAVVASVAFVAVGQQQGCSIPWPSPGPAPVPSDSFKVAFIVETADTLPKELTSVIYGGATRGYLDSKAKDWKVFDKDDKPSDPFWQAVLARPRASTPWVFATNGKATFEGPVTPQTLEALKKVGG